jgi:DNA-binding NarL/FixJ family response regulator
MIMKASGGVMNVKVLLVDDHGLFRSGLRALMKREPGFEVVGEAPDGRTGVRMAGELRPDLVVMDLRMPELNGIDATLQILMAVPSTKVIGVTANADARSTRDMLRAGASGLVAKDVAFDELLTAIRAVMKGDIYLSAAMRSEVANDGREEASSSVFGILTPREREVLQLLAEGNSTKEVAWRLKLSVKTAETHRRNLTEKLKISNIAGLTKFAIREGITQL